MGVLEKKRKIIDLDVNTMKILGVVAVQEGTSLKGYIEKKLKSLAEDLNEAKEYALLLKEIPTGNVIASEKEQKEFEEFLGL